MYMSTLQRQSQMGVSGIGQCDGITGAIHLLQCTPVMLELCHRQETLSFRIRRKTIKQFSFSNCIVL